MLGRDTDRCAAVLQKVDFTKVDTLTQKYALYSSIKTSDDWQNTKNAGGNYADIIGANFAEFQSRKQQLETTSRVNLDTATFDALATSYLQPEAIEAWKNCIGIGQKGLTAVFKDVSDGSLTVVIEWKAPLNGTFTLPPPVVNGGIVKSVAGDTGRRGGTLLMNGRLQALKVSGDTTRELIIQRTSKAEPLRFLMAADDYAVSLILPSEPPPPPPFKTTCTIQLNNFFVQASTEESSGTQVYRCDNMPPGRVVAADVSGMFHIDGVGPGAGWVTTEWYLNDSPGVNSHWCAGSEFDNGRQCNLQGGGGPPFGINVHVGDATIGGDGLATLRIHVSRAYDKDVHQHALVANSGTVTFTIH
jgi:hypothetical protein